jgi:hypothetical protein
MKDHPDRATGAMHLDAISLPDRRKVLAGLLALPVTGWAAEAGARPSTAISTSRHSSCGNAPAHHAVTAAMLRAGRHLPARGHRRSMARCLQNASRYLPSGVECWLKNTGEPR